MGEAKRRRAAPCRAADERRCEPPSGAPWHIGPMLPVEEDPPAYGMRRRRRPSAAAALVTMALALGAAPYGGRRRF